MGSSMRPKLMRPAAWLAACLAACLFAGQTAHAAEVERGKALYEQTCATCHGADGGGDPSQGAPRLAGQRAYYLQRQLRYFREGIRGTHEDDNCGALMRPNALALPDEQAIRDVVAHIGTLDAERPAVTVEGDIEAGRRAYSTCRACHGPKGEGMRPMNAPRIAGQHGWYLVRQLENFKEGIRGADPRDSWGQQMAPMAKQLESEKAVRDVVAYIRSLEEDASR